MINQRGVTLVFTAKENSRQDSPDNGYDLNSEVMLLCHTIAFLDEE